MKDKLILQGIVIELWKLLPILAVFVALNLYFIFIIHRVLFIFILLPLYGAIRLYYSPKCIITKNTAVLCRGRRTVRQLEKITARGILSLPGEQPHIFLCGVEKQKIEKYVYTVKKAAGNHVKTDDMQGKWETTLLFFLSCRAQKSEKVILLPYSRRRLKKLTSFLDVEIAEESIAAVLNNHTKQGMVLCL